MKHFVANIVVERGVEIGHGLLLLRHIGGDDVVFAGKHPVSPHMVQGAILGARHQPSTGFLRNARHRPMLERGEQGFLRQILGKRHVAQHPRQARDQPGLFDPPDREDRAM